MDIEECRRFYAEDVQLSANIQSPVLVEAFARVPREKFLGTGPWLIGSAEARAMSVMGAIQMSYIPVEDPRKLYHNVVVSLDREKDINNGQPSALGRWIDALDLKAGDRAYHLGCGVGYYTAILAEVVGPTGSVVAIDLNSELTARAQTNLADYPNVTVQTGDGADFDPGQRDAMLINAGMTHPTPLLLDRLSESGRMLIPLTMAVNDTFGVGVMARITCRHAGFSIEVVTSLAIYSCRNARDPEREQPLKTAMSSGRLMQMKSVRRDVHEQADSCVLHGRDLCLSMIAVGG